MLSFHWLTHTIKIRNLWVNLMKRHDRDLPYLLSHTFVSHLSFISLWVAHNVRERRTAPAPRSWLTNTKRLSHDSRALCAVRQVHGSTFDWSLALSIAVGRDLVKD